MTPRIIAVSKGRTATEIMALYELGQRDFGENRIVEALEKMKSLPADIAWHFIGRLQANKVRKAVGSFSLIHSVDSLQLAQKIDAVAREMGVTQSILIQVNTSQEKTKQGFSPDDLLLVFDRFMQFKHISLLGLMTMAKPFDTGTDDEVKNVRHSFATLRCLKEKIVALHPEIADTFTELSMGMSQDFELAVQEGATMVRIGSALFTKKS